MVKTLDFGVSPGYSLVKSQSIPILDGNFPAFLAAPTPQNRGLASLPSSSGGSVSFWSGPRDPPRRFDDSSGQRPRHRSFSWEDNHHYKPVYDDDNH